MGCSASAFATQEECSAGGTFCSYNCNGSACLCTTSGAFIGMIVGCVFGVVILIIVGCILLRVYCGNKLLAGQPNVAMVSTFGMQQQQPMWPANNNTNAFVVAGQPIQYGGQQQQQQQQQQQTLGFYNNGNNNNNNNNNFYPNNNINNNNFGAAPPPPPPPMGDSMPGFVTMQNMNNSNGVPPPGY